MNEVESSQSTMERPNLRGSRPLFQRYEFPILAEDSFSISQARSDPLACNINNDAVLIWNDVIFRPHDALPEISLSGVSIEDVFQELQTTAEVHLNSRNPKNNHGENTVPGERKRNRSSTSHHNNTVVDRRRLYEQGSDMELISLDDNDRTVLLLSETGEAPYGVQCHHIESENGSTRNCNGCDMSLNSDKAKLKEKEVKQKEAHDTEQYDKGYNLYSNGGYSKDINESFQWTPQGNISSQNDSDVFTVTAVCDNSMDKSRFDSGHFEDMSLDLSLSHFDNDYETAADCQIQNQVNRKHRKVNLYNEDTGENKESDEQHFSELSIEKSDTSCVYFDIEGDSEVFIEDADSADTTGSLPRPSTYPENYMQSEIPSRRRRGEDRFITVRCENQSCGKASNLSGARKSYKNCHHCLRTYYCSRECRRQDWTRHKESGVCHGSLVSSACKKVIRYCNSDPEVKGVLSRLATRGYLSHGRGCVMLGFPDLECTQEFLDFGFPVIELNPIYISAKELSESKMYGNILENLLEVCGSYRPDVKFVLNVGVGLRFNKTDFLDSSFHRHSHQQHYNCRHHHNHSHEQITDRSGSQGSDLGYGSLSNSVNNISKDSVFSPSRNSCSHCLGNHSRNSSNRSSSFSKHKGPILQKFIKLKLTPIHSQEEHAKRLTFEKHFWDRFRTTGPTLVLTRVPECSSSVENESKKRELTFINIQRKLRQRNVNLRHQYPAVHANLIEYVTKGVHFPSQILFPMDTKTGRTFTCFMMPEVEAEPEWMQSHYLLSDLRLSKDSLDKSMSRSLSSSMPSLVSSTSHNVSKSNLSLASTPEKSMEFNQSQVKPRSSSLPRLHSVKSVNNSSETMPKPFNNSSTSEIENNQKRSVSCHELSSAANDNRKNGSTGDIPEIRIPLPVNTNYDNIMSPLGIPVNPTPTEILVDPETLISNTSSNNNDSRNNELSENKVPTAHNDISPLDNSDQAIPSYYPVRKARNVKLCCNSNSHPSPGKFSTPQQQHKQQQQQQQQLQLLSAATPVSISIPSSFLATATASSPALYTSTPLTKTAEAPVFEHIIISSPSSSHLPPNFTPPTAPELSPIKNPSEETTPAIFHNENNNHILSPQHRNNNNLKGYRDIFSFDSNGSCLKYGSNGSRVCGCSTGSVEYGFDSCYRNEVVVDEVDRMKRRRKDRRSKSKMVTPLYEEDFCLFNFNSTTLDGPPLATSTLLRNSEEFGNRDCSRKHRRKKQKRSCSFDGNVEGNNNNEPITNSRVELARHDENRSNRISYENSNNNMENVCHDCHVYKCVQSHQESELPAHFRRKFNTNSPHFPKGSKLALPSPGVAWKKFGDDHNVMKHGLENSESHGRYTQINHSKNNFVSIITPQTDAHTRNKISIADSSPSSSLHPTYSQKPAAPLTTSRHDPQAKSPHLRMRVVKDVTHHSSNQMTEFSKSGSRNDRRKLKPTQTVGTTFSQREDDCLSRNTHNGYHANCTTVNYPKNENNTSSPLNLVTNKTSFHGKTPTHPSHYKPCAVKISYSSDW